MDYASAESPSVISGYLAGREDMFDDETKMALKPTHADEIYYLFDSWYELTSPNDLLMREIMIKYWTNFAKYGNPSPNNSEDLTEWLTYSSDKVDNICFLVFVF